MNFTLDKTSTQVLNHLVNSGSFIRPADLAVECGLSRRSVYYSVNRINEWLKANDLEPLVQKRNQGVSIQAGNLRQIQQLLHSESGDTPSLSPDARRELEICYLTFFRHDRIYIDDLTQYAGVSRNTVIQDLKHIGEYLEDYGLSLKYDLKLGYRILGDSIRRRAIFFLFYPGMIKYIDECWFPKEWLRRRDSYLEILRGIERDLDTEYVSGTLPTLAAFLMSLTPDSVPVSFDGMDVQEIKDTREFGLVSQRLDDLSEPEQVYVTLHLLGSRLQTIPVSFTRGEPESSHYAQLLVDEFEQVSCIAFDRKEELVTAIAAHLHNSLYRYKYGIQIGNPMLDDIRNEYRSLFELTQRACRGIKKEKGFTISEAEIAYLTLHFGAFLNTDTASNNDFRILIICPNGIGTGNMLKKEIRHLVPQATEITHESLKRYQPIHGYDLVVSTVPLTGEKHQVVVNPILTDQDRITILRSCMHTEPVSRVQITEICQLASRYIPAQDMEKFRRDLQEYFSSQNQVLAPARNEGNSLVHYLSQGHVQLIDQAKTWQDAIQQAAGPLLQNGSITQSYIEAILRDQIELGHCMFLTRGLVMAHTAPEHGVNRTDISLAALKSPVTFGNGEEARIVMVLAAEDQTQHLNILTDILSVFSRKQAIERIAGLNSVQEILDYIEKHTEKH